VVQHARERRVGRELAHAVVDLLGEEATALTERSADSFIKELSTLLKPTPTAEDSPNLKHYHMPFGKYQGVNIQEVPKDYLSWLCDSSREVSEIIKAYLDSDIG
jgi:hypothetical protein